MIIKEKELTVLRDYEFAKGVNVTLDEVREAIEEIIQEIDEEVLFTEDEIQMKGIFGDSINAFSVVNQVHSLEYMKFAYIIMEQKKCIHLLMAVYGSGDQVKVKDLIPFYQKAKAEGTMIAAAFNRGNSTAYGIGSGVGWMAGRALSGSVKLVAKSIRVAMRDKEKYEAEMSYYQKMIEVCDAVVQ